jgi:hypothetical protein
MGLSRHLTRPKSWLTCPPSQLLSRRRPTCLHSILAAQLTTAAGCSETSGCHESTPELPLSPSKRYPISFYFVVMGGIGSLKGSELGAMISSSLPTSLTPLSPHCELSGFHLSDPYFPSDSHLYLAPRCPFSFSCPPSKISLCTITEQIFKPWTHTTTLVSYTQSCKIPVNLHVGQGKIAQAPLPIFNHLPAHTPIRSRSTPVTPHPPRFPHLATPLLRFFNLTRPTQHTLHTNKTLQTTVHCRSSLAQNQSRFLSTTHFLAVTRTLQPLL